MKRKLVEENPSSDMPNHSTVDYFESEKKELHNLLQEITTLLEKKGYKIVLEQAEKIHDGVAIDNKNKELKENSTLKQLIDLILSSFGGKHDPDYFLTYEQLYRDQKGKGVLGKQRYCPIFMTNDGKVVSLLRFKIKSWYENENENENENEKVSDSLSPHFFYGQIRHLATLTGQEYQSKGFGSILIAVSMIYANLSFYDRKKHQPEAIFDTVFISGNGFDERQNVYLKNGFEFIDEQDENEEYAILVDKKLFDHRILMPIDHQLIRNAMAYFNSKNTDLNHQITTLKKTMG